MKAICCSPIFNLYCSHVMCMCAAKAWPTILRECNPTLLHSLTPIMKLKMCEEKCFFQRRPVCSKLLVHPAFSQSPSTASFSPSPAVHAILGSVGPLGGVIIFLITPIHRNLMQRERWICILLSLRCSRRNEQPRLSRPSWR